MFLANVFVVLVSTVIIPRAYKAVIIPRVYKEKPLFSLYALGIMTVETQYTLRVACPMKLAMYTVYVTDESAGY